MTGAMNDLGQITVWGQVNGDRTVLDVNDVSGVDLDVNDVKGVVLGVVSDVNDVEGVVLGVVSDVNGVEGVVLGVVSGVVLGVVSDVNDVSGVVSDVNDVEDVVSDVNDVLDGLDDPDVNVDLVQLTVWIQGNDWGQGNNVDGFGHRFVQCFQLKLVCLVECQGFGALLACPLTLELCLGCRVKLLCLFPASPDHLFLVSFQFRGLLPLTVLQHRPCHSGDGGQWNQDAFQMYVVPPFFEVSLFTG